MSEDLNAILRRFDYAFPQGLIAQAPASPRDSARLVVLNRATATREWTHMREIGSYLPKNAVLVLNETKVIPARLFLTKQDGTRAGMLWVGTDATRVVRMLGKGAFRSGEILTLTDGKTFTVEGRDEKEVLLRPSFPLRELQSLFEQHGAMPLPPYIDQSPLTEAELKERYQSVFARNSGSIAAPTASLHFTPELLAVLEASGITLARVTLHVHLGTFSPLTSEQWSRGELHREEYMIDPATVSFLETAKQSGRPIIPVGTTALRTLESAFDADGRCIKSAGDTTLFIREGYTFKMASGLLTNFHVPKSSLLMLVCAFGGHEFIMETYRQAIEKEFRLFSFGDGMLVL